MRGNRRGSALLDALLGLALTGLAVAIVHSGQIATRGEVEALERRTQALLRAQEILELAAVELRAAPVPSLSTRPLPDRMSAVLDVRAHPAHRALRQVTVTVRYTAGTHERHVELVRLMSAGSRS